MADAGGWGSLVAPASTTSQDGDIRAQFDTADGDKSGKKVESNKDEAATRQLTEPSPYMLPVELLTQIFADFNTSEVILASQVSRSWRAAAQAPHLWRNVAFTAATGPLYLDRDYTSAEQLRSLIARAEGKVTSVDFAHLSGWSVQLLCKLLEPSLDSMRHIRWSASAVPPERVLSVLNLAKRCPHLETLELRDSTFVPSSQRPQSSRKA